MGTQLELVWFDGEIIPSEEANVSVMTHALHYGTAVFEGIRAYFDAGELYVFRLEDHMRRLVDSARMLHIECQYSVPTLVSAVPSLLRGMGLRTSVYIRPILFVGVGGIQLDYRKHPKHLAIFAYPFSGYFRKSGLRVCISSWRRVSDESVVPRAKAASNYLNSSIATIEAKLAGYDEAILLDTHGHVSEGAGENVFLVKDGIVCTPPVYSSILEGITRDTVISLANDFGITVVERPIQRSELYTADELFFTGTATEVESILEVDGRKIGNGEPGRTTRQIRDLYMKVVKGRSSKYRRWLTKVYGQKSGKLTRANLDSSKGS
ncbi:MAG: branched-chain amino acid transaminase [Thaumarchaeota archaeon]|nr:branched-chain amino acid transaminase [Nitrososphaerota archaeon]